MKMHPLSAGPVLAIVALGALAGASLLTPVGVAFQTQKGDPLPAGALARLGPARPDDKPGQDVTLVAISSDGCTAALLTRCEATVRLWETATGKQNGEINPGTAYAMAMTPGKSPRLVLQVGEWIAFYDIASKEQQGKRRGMLERLAFADGGRLLFGGQPDGEIVGLDVDGDLSPAGPRPFHLPGRRLHYFSGHPNTGGLGLFALSPSADGKLLATSGFSEPGVKLWDIKGGRQLPAFHSKKIPGLCLSLTPDGRTLAADGSASLVPNDSDAIHFWDTATARELRCSAYRPGVVSALAFAPDGRLLAEGRTDGTVLLLETATGGERRILSGQRGPITSLAWSADGRTLISASRDTTALVWDATGLSSDPLAAKKLSPAELASLWSDLAGPTNWRTHRAVWLLAARPEQTMPFLRERVRPALASPAIDPEVIARLLSELDSEQFAVREQASRELRKLSKTAEPALRKVLAGKPSVEVRRRVEELLEALTQWPPEDLRAVRAMEALEHMASADAEKLLQALANGSPGARLTREAEASLNSLRRCQVALGKAAAPILQTEGKPEYVAGEWVPLFNGTDLTNWQIHDNRAAFAVNKVERAIMARPSEPISLLQTSRDFADFHLRFEFKIASQGADSGVNIRQPLNPPQRTQLGRPYRQLEIQVRDVALEDAQPNDAPTGSLFWGFDSSRPFKPEAGDLLRPRGEWNQMEIIVRGPAVRVVVNGKPATNADLSTVAGERRPSPVPAARYSQGRIAVQADRGEVWYRKIEIRELKLRPAR